VTVEPLAMRVFRDQPFHLGDKITVKAEHQVGLDPLFERFHPQLIEASGLDAGERLIAELGQGRPPPESERLP
jgi:hypothetical protein